MSSLYCLHCIWSFALALYRPLPYRHDHVGLFSCSVWLLRVWIWISVWLLYWILRSGITATFSSNTPNSSSLLSWFTFVVSSVLTVSLVFSHVMVLTVLLLPRLLSARLRFDLVIRLFLSTWLWVAFLFVILLPRLYLTAHLHGPSLPLLPVRMLFRPILGSSIDMSRFLRCLFHLLGFRLASISHLSGSSL